MSIFNGVETQKTLTVITQVATLLYVLIFIKSNQYACEIIV